MGVHCQPIAQGDESMTAEKKKEKKKETRKKERKQFSHTQAHLSPHDERGLHREKKKNNKRPWGSVCGNRAFDEMGTRGKLIGRSEVTGEKRTR